MITEAWCTSRIAGLPWNFSKLVRRPAEAEPGLAGPGHLGRGDQPADVSGSIAAMMQNGCPAGSA